MESFPTGMLPDLGHNSSPQREPCHTVEHPPGSPADTIQLALNDVRNVTDIRGHEIGNRFGNGHVSSGRRIQERQGCSFTHRQGFARIGVKTGRRDRNICDRHLRDQPSDPGPPFR